MENGGRELKDPTGWSAPPPSGVHDEGAQLRSPSRSSAPSLCSVLPAAGPRCLGERGDHAVPGGSAPRGALQPPAATPSVFAASASWLPAGTQWLELGGGGRGRIPSRPLPPRQSRERSEKYLKVLRGARAKRKGTTPHQSRRCVSRPRHSGCTSGCSAHGFWAFPAGASPLPVLSARSRVQTREGPGGSSHFLLGHHAQRRRVQQALCPFGGPARRRGTPAGQGRGLWQSGRGAAREQWRRERRGQRRRRRLLGLRGVGHGLREQEVPAAAQVRAMQEPRLRVAAQGPQALLHVAGLPVQEVQPDRRETARDGRAGECGRPGTERPPPA